MTALLRPLLTSLFAALGRGARHPFAAALLALPLLALPLLAAGSLLPEDARRELVVQAAEAALTDRYLEAAARFEVRYVRSGGDLEAADHLRARFVGDGSVPRGHTRLVLLAGDEETGWRETGWAMVYVAHYDSVLVPHRPVAAGEEVAPGALAPAWIETTTLRGESLRPAQWRALTRSGPAFARRPLVSGRPLLAGDLRAAYAAEPGTTVTMSYRRGSVALRIACKARESGVVGDVIRLYASDTRVSYRARLTGPGTATWIETL